MIVVDTSELTSDSRLPPIPNSSTSDILEKLTGGDILISPLSMPATTETLIRRHVDAGAVLINRKSMADMLSSIASGSINTILARMLAAGAKYTWQRVIMSTGVYAPDLDTGSVLIGEPRQSPTGNTYIYLQQVTPQGLPSYKAYASIRRRIAMRGGYYLPLVCDDEIPGELLAWEKDLQELSETKEVWPMVAKMVDPPACDDPLQTPVEVKDWRAVLVAFPGLGPAKVNALRTAMLEFGAEDTLFQALFLASAQGRLGMPKVPGWGPNTIQSMRDALGLQDGLDITVGTIEF
jgi:hypothetical protein